MNRLSEFADRVLGACELEADCSWGHQMSSVLRIGDANGAIWFLKRHRTGRATTLRQPRIATGYPHCRTQRHDRAGSTAFTAEFSGSEVWFDDAKFSGARVDLGDRAISSHPPIFNFAGSSPA